VSRTALIAVEIFVAAGAAYGGVGLIADNKIKIDDTWLATTPFATWTWPGILLLAVVALPMTVAAALESFRRPSAYARSLAAGTAQIGWIIVQWAVMQRYFILQPVMFGAGLIVVILAIVAHAHESVKPHRHNVGGRLAA
jgi:hypothetical protein